MLQQKKPSDFVIGTGQMHSVKEFLNLAFSIAGLNYKKFLKIDKKLYRPAEVDTLRADYSKARKLLKWEPTINFKDLVKEMVTEDIKLLNNE